MDAIEKNLLKEVTELDALPVGAYNIRANGQRRSGGAQYHRQHRHRHQDGQAGH